MINSDERIHLSDRLVTCGEYQPFLDEMHMQGKYHQPDHWISSQFPEGQPDEPVLGVRPLDAVAYCIWLTGREDTGWSFRIPAIQETLDQPITSSGGKPLGYWTTGDGEQSQFNWIGIVPENARGIDLYQAFTRSIEHLKTNVNEQESARSRAFDLLRIFDLEQTLKHPLDLDRDLSLARKHAYENASILQIHPTPELAKRLDQSLDRDFDRAIDFARALERGSDRSEAIEHALRHALVQALESSRSLDRSIMSDLLIYVDLLTLQERIAGRSPAFEGIRVVKERI